MLTVEELLKPRYKCIADYPGMTCSVGDIFIEHKWDNGNCSYVTNPISLLDGHNLPWSIIKSYPHLFKPLAWYEERKEEDMPEYLRFSPTNKIIMVRFYGIEPFEIPNGDKSLPKSGNYVIRYSIDYFGYIKGKTLDCFIPATEEEYLTYINNQKL